MSKININQGYFRFMTDIIDSGTWGNLSHAAKALYPVLIKYSDFHFKPVWPGTEELQARTGIKSKKMIAQARRELQAAGLIHFIPGTGRTSTRYYFRFDYPNSQIKDLAPGVPLQHPPECNTNAPQGKNIGTPGGAQSDPAVLPAEPSLSPPRESPNNIQITITNNNQKEQLAENENLSQVRKETGQSEPYSDTPVGKSPGSQSFGSPGSGGAPVAPATSEAHNINHWYGTEPTRPVKNRLPVLESDPARDQEFVNRQWRGVLEVLARVSRPAVYQEIARIEPLVFEDKILICGELDERLRKLVCLKFPGWEIIFDSQDRQLNLE